MPVKFTGNADGLDRSIFLRKEKTMNQKPGNENLPTTHAGGTRYCIANGSTAAHAKRLAEYHVELSALAEKASANKSLRPTEVYAKRRGAVAPPARTTAEIYAARRQMNARR
jgi:hypothetical protein